MTVADFIAWLQTQDQGAIVQVVVEERRVWDTRTDWVEFDPEHHSQYIDLRGNQFVKDDSPLRDRRYLELGITA